ncbi:MAG: hypothetical protein QW372_06650 [Nitrososphaerales archaeon]
MKRFYLYEKCPYCARYFTTKVALELHLELDHECYQHKARQNKSLNTNRFFLFKNTY